MATRELGSEESVPSWLCKVGLDDDEDGDDDSLVWRLREIDIH